MAEGDYYCDVAQKNNDYTLYCLRECKNLTVFNLLDAEGMSLTNCYM